MLVYRPSGAVTQSFTDQVSDLLDQLLLLNAKSVIVGDFNVPGDAIDVFEQYSLQQHVTSPIHVSGNTLDLILTQEEELSGRLVSDVVVQSVWFSDHQLLKCRLGMLLPRPVTTMYTYWSLHKIDTAAFCYDILQSELFGSVIKDVDVYAELFDPRSSVSWTCTHHSEQANVVVVSMITAACRTMPEKPFKQLRRRIKRHYRRTGLQSDKEAYVSAARQHMTAA